MLPPGAIFELKAPKYVCGRDGLRWGSFQRSPDPLAGFRWLLRDREGDGRKGEGREGGEREGEGRVIPLLFTV